MKYRAIQTRKHEMRFEKRDMEAGIVGQFTRIEDEVVLFSSDSKEEAELRLKAHFYDNPNEACYLVDEENRVLGTFLHKGEADARDKLSEQKCFSVGLCVVLLLNVVLFIGSSQFTPRVAYLIAVAGGMVLIYIGIVKMEIANCIEGAVAVVVISFVTWMAVGARGC